VNQKGIIGLLLPIRLIIAVIIVAVYLFQSPQIFKPKAAEQANSQEHIISKAIINSQPYLYNKSTGKIFIPRGNVYANTQQVPDPWGGTSTSGWEWFYPNYDKSKITQDLQKMQTDGYNSIRVAVSPITIGSPSSQGLNIQMLKNIADFLNTAKQHNIFVLLTVSLWPHSGGYAPASDPQDPLLDVGGGNFFYLSPKALETRKKYLRDLINGLKQEGAPLDIIWAYDLDGEIAFSPNLKPFKNYQGQIITNAGNFSITGNTSKQEKEYIMNKNIIVYINTLTSTIKSVDPTALVSVQMYPPALQIPPGQEGNSDFERYVPAKWLVASPNVKEGDLSGVDTDLIALSMYPNTYGQNYQCQLSSLQIPGIGGDCNYPLRPGTNPKPIFVEEMGYVRNSGAQENVLSASEAAPKIKNWMSLECSAGIRGWHMFTWNTLFNRNDGTSVSDYFTAIEDNEAINNAIKPTVWPNICGDDMDLILITGDTDGDNDIDIFDYNLVITDFGKTNDPNTKADLDNDDDVDIFDYNFVVSNFGR